MKNLRIAANVSLVLLFFLTDLKTLPWQMHFLFFACATLLDTLSTFFGAYMDDWNWGCEANPDIQKMGKEIGFEMATWLHTLILICFALAFGKVFSYFLPMLAGLILFWLAIAACIDAALHNFVLAIFKKDLPSFFCPDIY